MQAAVSGRRRRDGAEAVVGGLAVRLLDAVDLDTSATELVHAFDEPVEPSRPSLWIEPPSVSHRL